MKNVKFVKVILHYPTDLIIADPANPNREILLNGSMSDEGISKADRSVVVPLDELFGVTEVESDIWDRWLAYHKDSPMVKNKVIFAVKDSASAKSYTREMEREPLPLRGVDPNQNTVGEIKKPSNKQGSTFEAVDIN